MIEMPRQFQVSKAPPPPPAHGAAEAGFAHTLATFLDREAVSTDPPGDVETTDKRSGIADDGKNLPDDGNDTNDNVPDSALLWLPLGLPQPPATRPGVSASDHTPVPAGGIGLTSPDLAGARFPPAPATTGEAPGDDGASDAAVDAAVIVRANANPVTPTVDSVPPDKRTMTRAIDETAVAGFPIAAQPQPAATPTPAVVQPAGQAFAAAIAAAAMPHGHRPEDDRVSASPDALSAATPLDLFHKLVVHAAGDAQQGTLDLRDDRNLQHMIDRIEILRDDASDGADARDTRIRLIPDALGGVDIAVRRDGDAVHVRFTADHDTTRALLHDAQPRLSELAEARGVRIAGASVDVAPGSERGAGEPGGGASQRPRAAPPIPSTPAPVVEADAETVTDMRLA